MQPPLDILPAIWQHKWRGLSFFLGTMVLVTSAVLFWPQTFRSEARLFVRLGRESVTLDPTATVRQTLQINESREVEINSIMEILKSRMIAEQVENVLGSDVILSGVQLTQTSAVGGSKSSDGADSWIDWIDSALQQLRELARFPVVSQSERAATLLEKSLEVWAPKKSNVICVRYEAATPELAQRVVQTLLAVYTQEHIRAHRAEGSYAFFVDQAELLKGTLQEAYSELRDAKNQIDVASLEGHRDSLQEQISAIDLQIGDTQTELAAANAKIAALSKSLTLLPERLVTQNVSGFSNEAADRMREVLYRLEVQERELRSKFTDGHPLVLAIADQVKQSRTLLETQAEHRSQSTSSVNPNYQQSLLAQLNEQASVAALESRAKALRDQQLAARQRIHELNHAEINLADLQRNVDLLEASYRSYAEKLEQARIDQQLDSGRISNVNVVQPPTYLAKAAKPNRLLIAVLGLIVATVGGLGVTLLKSSGERVLSTAIEVQGSLNVPVLACIPPLSPSVLALRQTVGEGAL